jgi:hypothetical protein
MQSDDFSAASERLNAGAEIPAVASSVIERMWVVISRLPPEQRQHTAVGLGAFADIDPRLLQDPGQVVAMLVRYDLLDGLIELGILDDYMNDESQRKRVFAAAASFPCNKDDLGEATMQKMLRDRPPDVVQSTYEEYRQAGYDPEHPKVAERFKRWMHDNC